MSAFILSSFPGAATIKTSGKCRFKMVSQPRPKPRILPTPLPATPPSNPVPRTQTSLPQVTVDPTLFANKLVLLTGATGFVGSVILYKLLKLSSDSHIVLLTRPKIPVQYTGSTPLTAVQRMWHMLSTADVFAPLRVSCSSRELYNLFTERITVVESDLTKPLLGITEHHLEVIRRLAMTKRGIKILHCGANVNFSDTLTNLADSNVRPVVQFMRLVEKLGDAVENFVYVSTAYVNSYQAGVNIPVSEFKSENERNLMQQIGPTSVDSFLSLSPSDIDKLEQRVLRFFPNNYVYSKLLSETLLESWANQLYTKRPSLIIIRPTTICASRQEPSPGFVSSRDAFCAILLAYGRGLLQRLRFPRDHILDIVPVDTVANATLLAAVTSHSAPEKFIVHVGSGVSASLPLYDYFAGAQDTFRSQNSFPGSVLPCVTADRLLDTSVELRDDISRKYGRRAKLAARVEKQFEVAFSYFLHNSWMFESTSLRLLESASPPNVSEVLHTSMSHYEAEFPDYIHNFAASILRMIISDAEKPK